jgi:hypothetical protein
MRGLHELDEHPDDVDFNNINGNGRVYRCARVG